MTDYIVHSRHDTEADVPVKTGEGHEITGKLPVALIELVPVGGGVGRSITLERPIPNGPLKAAVDAVFNVGAVVRDGEFTLVKAPEAKATK